MSEHTPGPWREIAVEGGWDGVGHAAGVICKLAENNPANGRLIAQAPRMKDLLEEILEEFEDRFDGAPDAKMQWMGHLMFEIKMALADIKNQRFP